MEKKILIVEDEFIVANDLSLILKRAGYEVCGIADSVPEALRIIEDRKPTLVLLDIHLKGKLTGIDLARQLKKNSIAFVYLSANSNQKILEAAKVTEPYGFLVKPFREKDVLITLDIACYRHEHSLEYANRNKEGTGNKIAFQFSEIIGASHSLLQVFDLVARVAPSETSVLILGETGTGKELIARAIHHASPRIRGPYVKINCGALPGTLIESELFGHEKGAFTGALEKKIGKFEQAHGGTILLDEVAEMPPEMQVKLLRVLQEREIERVGGKETIKVDVRIIAATNKNLEKEVGEGRFRLDLYYRLNVYPITLPPLRERKEDIPLLANFFANNFFKKIKRRSPGISTNMMAALEAYGWPGNIRELENVLEQAVIMNDGESPLELGRLLPAEAQTATTTPAVKTFGDVRKQQADTEKEYILSVLKKTEGRIRGEGGAAELLDLKPTTLESRLKKLGIRKEDYFSGQH